MGFLTSIVVGAIAGWLASLIMKSGYGLIGDIILGVIGGFVGGFLSQLFLGVNLMSGFNITSILTAAIGAIIVLVIARFFRRG
jgi:uncharacterized membrane protein YeaQ/YmgE (transglycosylase-associated protein family)